MITISSILLISTFIIVSKAELIFVNELFRHGARGTIVDETWNSDLDEWMKEELTPTGMR